MKPRRVAGDVSQYEHHAIPIASGFCGARHLLVQLGCGDAAVQPEQLAVHDGSDRP